VQPGVDVPTLQMAHLGKCPQAAGSCEGGEPYACHEWDLLYEQACWVYRHAEITDINTVALPLLYSTLLQEALRKLPQPLPRSQALLALTS
jgi:hypothetical protein